MPCPTVMPRRRAGGARVDPNPPAPRSAQRRADAADWTARAGCSLACAVTFVGISKPQEPQNRSPQIVKEM
ncbi:hypothetical protein GCM10009416_24810 [Craurococcus roseus]|uniref:Uncharacterized protein n=1 Tax=Craurococcus roseus TaxID=77585 RepID=A0ABN1F911_9PROT